MSTQSLLQTKQRVYLKSGMEFTMGYAINPDFKDIRYVVRVLWDFGITDKVVPGVSLETVLGSDKASVESLVPLIIRMVERQVEEGEIEWPLPGRVEVCLYVLGWYWHRRLGGPKYTALYEVRARTKNYGQIPFLGCPFCHKSYKPHKRFKRQSVVFKNWLVWLLKHSIEYHKWDALTARFLKVK
jgi:hypothetical protein